MPAGPMVRFTGDTDIRPVFASILVALKRDLADWQFTQTSSPLKSGQAKQMLKQVTFKKAVNGQTVQASIYYDSGYEIRIAFSGPAEN